MVLALVSFPHNCSESSSSLSSCITISTDIPDPITPPQPIVHCFWKVFRATSCIGTELLYVGSSWSFCLCSSMGWGKQVRTPVALLRSLSGKYPWEKYEPPYPPSYGLNSTITVLLREWLWHYIYLATPPLGQDMTQGQF